SIWRPAGPTGQQRYVRCTRHTRSVDRRSRSLMQPFLMTTSDGLVEQAKQGSREAVSLMTNFWLFLVKNSSCQNIDHILRVSPGVILHENL
ncbi:hypothetical protein PENTCL1PPCAC_19120, partial [Pristionchus entomophagus]